ncbi:MAG: hypothetical protein AB8B64_16555 [Granulosicoccus sp.]
MDNVCGTRQSGRSFDRVEFSFDPRLAAQDLTQHFVLLVLRLIALVWMILPKQLVFSDPAEYLLMASDLKNLQKNLLNLDYPFEHHLSLLFAHWFSLE